ncbi:MAG: nucleotide sugar dehydrogenase [Hyphomicrobiaceae bacterium]|nr:nucleotide sugar dehydrogenase [Hyphomicrobiaceae bacterium]
MAGLSTSAAGPSPTAASIAGRIDARDFTVGIMGLGYVGLPLALVAVRAGFTVLGFDTDPARVAQLNRGRSAIKHIPDATLAAMVENGKFCATSDFSRLAEADAILIAVPTPLNRYREPDLSYVEQSTRSIAAALRPGQLIVLESTTWPGTTVEVMKPLLEATGLKCGEDFFLGFSPEREDPGNDRYGTASIPKVVGADDPASRHLATALYDALVVKTVPVSSSATAEAVKLTENIFRSVNIALVNELKIIFDKMGIDVWEVIEAAKSKPFGYMPFYPGPGLGGHCIPIDPFYLTWKAREYEVATRFIELSGQINTGMPHYVIERLAEALDRRFGRGLNGARILIVGMAYKKNVDDIRESPSLKLTELIERRGGHVDYHDPFIPAIPVTRAHADLAGRLSVSLDPSVVATYDAVLISTDHDDIDWAGLVRSARLVVDTRNVCERNGASADNVIKA